MGCPQSKQSPPPAVALPPPPAQVVTQPTTPTPKPSKKTTHTPSSTLTIAFCRDVPTDELARRVAEHRGVTRVLRVEASRLGAGGGAQLSRAVVLFDDDEPVPARRLSDQSARVAKLLILYEDAGNSLKDAFDKFDKSGDGNISIHELLVGLQGLGTAFANISREEVEKIVIDAFDKDLDDAHISLHEFTEFVKRARAEA